MRFPFMKLWFWRLICLLCLVGLSVSLAAEQAAPPIGSSTPAAVPAYRQANKVAILTVDGIIDRVTLMSLERRMKRAVRDGADAVVLEINTPGGEMFATLEICSLLKNRNDTPANVVAWIHPVAFSAGTIIALACREIIVSPNSTFGDAAPIAATSWGSMVSLQPHERAKILAPLLSEIIDSARRNHYDEKLVQSFVMLGVELWMIEHTGSGQRILVDRDEYRTVFGQDPPAQSGANVPQRSATQPAPLRPWIDRTIPRTSDYAGLDPEELRKQSEIEQTLPPARDRLTDADRGQWRLIMQVTDGNTLLTVKADQALYYGLATAVIGNDDQIKSFFGAQSVRRYDQTWSEDLVRFLTSFWVKGILIAIFLVGLFIEMAAPGFGVFGGAAALALLLLIGAPALAGMAQWWDILLIVAGIVLVAVELFLIPGIGVAGVAGVLSLLVGLVGTFVSSDVSSTVGQNELWTGLVTTLAALFVAGVVIWFVSKQVHTLPVINRLILHAELRDSAPASPSMLQAMGAAAGSGLAVGDVGRAETDLRPAGRASFNSRLVDVKSISSYIDKGTAIRIVSVGSFVIEVEEAGS